MNDNILIIDGEPDVGKALERVLKERGFPCRNSVSAEEAIDLMKQIRFKMAFLDAQLPDMKGAELAGKLKSMDPDINIVVVAGRSPQDAEDCGLKMDARLFDACIYKPYLSQAIHDAVDTFM
jgi:DNA-binding NtrC family response regulator